MKSSEIKWNQMKSSDTKWNQVKSSEWFPMLRDHFPRWETFSHGGKSFSTVRFPVCLAPRHPSIGEAASGRLHQGGAALGLWKMVLPLWEIISHRFPDCRRRFFPATKTAFPGFLEHATSGNHSYSVAFTFFRTSIHKNKHSQNTNVASPANDYDQKNRIAIHSINTVSTSFHFVLEANSFCNF